MEAVFAYDPSVVTGNSIISRAAIKHSHLPWQPPPLTIWAWSTEAGGRRSLPQPWVQPHPAHAHTVLSVSPHPRFVLTRRPPSTESFHSTHSKNSILNVTKWLNSPQVSYRSRALSDRVTQQGNVLLEIQGTQPNMYLSAISSLSFPFGCVHNCSLCLQIPNSLFLSFDQIYGAWRAAVYGVAQSQTRLKWLSSSSSINIPWKVLHILINHS